MKYHIGDIVEVPWKVGSAIKPYRGKVVGFSKRNHLKIKYDTSPKTYSHAQHKDIRIISHESKYPSSLKQHSANKRKCRETLVQMHDALDLKTTSQAIVLDDEHLMTVKTLGRRFALKHTFTPNYDESIISKMKRVRKSVVSYEPLGEFLCSSRAPKQVSFVYMDYMGMPGSVRQKNSPMSDIDTLFRLHMLHSKCILGITVCARSASKTKIKFENVYTIIQQVYASANTYGYMAILKNQFHYTDKGSSTMLHCAFEIYN